MRFLHTSDWHLGRTLHGLDLRVAHESFLDSLIGTVREKAPAAVLISGDIFDRAVPPVESVALFERALHDLSELTSVVVIAGNHDSAVRLGYGSTLYRDGITVATEITSCGTPLVLNDAFGPVAFYPIPYLDPDHARSVLSRADDPLPRSHQAVMTAAMDRVRQDLTARRKQYPRQRVRAVVLAHAFVVGGSPSESERDIRVGGVDSVSVETFAGVHYVALGHLHGPQQLSTPPPSTADHVPSTPTVRYGGSPLRYSFSEATQHKSLTLVDIDASGACNVELLPLHQPREMAVLTGRIDELLAASACAEHAQSWVRLVVTDEARPRQLTERLRAAYPHALAMVHAPESGPKTIDITAGRTSLPARDPVDISREFVMDVTSAPATDDEINVYRSAYESIR